MATIIDGYSYTYYLIVVTICYWLLLFNIDIIDKEYNIVDIDRNSVVLSFLDCGLQDAVTFILGKTGRPGIYHEVIPSRIVLEWVHPCGVFFVFRSLTAQEQAAKIHLEYVAPHTLKRELRTYVRRSKHGTDSMVISLGGIAPQGSLSLHTVGAHFWPQRRWII